MSTWAKLEEMEQYIKWFVKWSGLSEDFIRKAILRNKSHYYEDEFKVINPQSPEELTWWYRCSSRYFFHLSSHTFWDILSQIDLKEPILDYGGGLGNNFFPLVRKGFNTHYFDVSYTCTNFVRWRLNEEDMIGRTKYRYKIISPFDINNKFSYIDCIQDNYDTIILQDVIEHIYDYEKLLHHLIDYLNVEGLLLEETYFGEADIGEHVHLKEKNSLQDIMKNRNMKKLFEHCWVKEK